jgi:hypothetical protein
MAVPDVNIAPIKRSNFTFNTYAAIGFIVFSALMFAVIPSQIEKPMVIFGQSLNALDPKLFPSIVAAGFGILGIWFFCKSFAIKETNGFDDLGREGLFNIVITVSALTAYASLMEPLGFVPSSALLVAGLTIFYGTRNILLIAVVWIGVPGAIYFVFKSGLKLFLPEIPCCD